MSEVQGTTIGNSDHAIPASLVIVQKFAGGSNVASAVYGTIITIAVLGAWYADPTSGALETLISVLATLVVFWVAHAYSHIVGHELSKEGVNRTNVFSAFRHDWPIVQSGFLPLLVLLAGSLEFIDERHSLLLAIIACGVLLAFFCLAMARVAKRSWVQSLVLTAVMVTLGAFVAVLEMSLG